MISTSTNARAVGWWLFACCAMVLTTLVVGGVTRLTHSGLSIVEWQPLLGALPPLSESDWLKVFAQYQQSPEFRLVNSDMTLDGFKFIFWWEWTHRLLGRAIGLVFFLPFLAFVLMRKIPAGLMPRLLGFFLLGGLQGAMGWYMVKSGLVDDPRVSQYRLAAHLGLAFLIFGLMLWTALGLLQRRAAIQPEQTRGVRRFGVALAALVFVMVLSGALVAGLRAGLVYNTFPLMMGYFVPPDMWAADPWWLNFFANLATVQFDHRMIAWSLMVLVPLFWWQVRRRSAKHAPRRAATAMLAMLVIQVTLGISTLLQAVPVPLAAAHQAGAMLLFATILWVNHALRVGSNSH
jgi:cytochrome c oxidase assembly protein subunit 15